jgi:DNA-binding NarL/FixJ family response regulator
MYLQVHTPELIVRRNKHSLRRRLRRGHELAEFARLSNGAGNGHVRPVVSIAFIDPKPLTRQSILEMLAGALPEHVRLVGASDFDELLELGKPEKLTDLGAEINFIILYIRSAGVKDTWVQAQLHLIRRQQPQLPVIMMSDRDDSNDIINALNCGVRGYIPTSIAAEVAIAALTLIEAGGTYIPANVMRSESAELRGSGEANQHLHPPNELNLTLRELAVIDLLREGNSNKLIALKLDMRESTVKVHMRNILKKLGVSNRTHAATVANRLLAQATPETESLALTKDEAPARRH